MVLEDYNLDMSTKSVEITYSLPAEMMQAPNTPPIHVTNIKKIEGGRSNGNSIYVNQSFVSKDALLLELRLTAVRFGFSFRIYKSTKTLLVTTCPVSGCQWKVRASVEHGTSTFWVTKYVEKHTCSVVDRLAQRRHCTPKYVGRLFIDRVGIIDGLNPQHITDAMKNMFGMTLDYTTSYRALLYAQTLIFLADSNSGTISGLDRTL
ncbi:hypothetical protein F2Q68_00026434 [Brassica cretica]|uniref:Transposase MuDR plant domain-containing protein n=1 Tax=Brassica cretica TaxID=69181 RepID=A0A8S9ICV4_BRACR|nr:hypothetical protein F2Q68_00026434 [Brassica cretica]